ncbi:ankyrin repeat domain-containing protein [Neisseria subflava]|uniref:ankyrin repeat domain-containing protein n=1 Tax=Neisseria subflava TaxID=28449 RepID=UPI000D310AE4|nr:ankyrin repeat domain-containing protein [Neisseria subflava]
MNLSKFNDLDLEEKIVESNFNNDLQLLRKIFLENKLSDIKKVTSLDKWNYLHRILCYSEPKVELIQFYIDNGVDVDAQDIYGMTPLHYALRSKNAEAAIALLKAGANPNLPNQDGLIPLSMIGYIPERLDVLELMLQKGANVHYLVNEDETILESYKPTANEPQLKPIYELMKKYS